MQDQARRGSGVPVAIERDALATEGSLRVSSPDLGSGAAIPTRFSEYGEGLSPALRWSPVEGAASYLVIVEDPDARPTTPFVHWVAWNIPGDLSELPQGLQEQARLTDPEGVLQGRTSRGSTGWFGPRPPVGDPPHHYHFQVFALDTRLDLQPGADRDTVLAAAEGHVIAAGELVGTYQQQTPPTT
uniref:YbhB/YbcL family Raf kinase inhibitor-like protein n=1 Tax=Coralloluteibacterium stylophorae TaxID=1776034 RepID=A0A8J8AYU8_9GAMM